MWRSFQKYNRGVKYPSANIKEDEWTHHYKQVFGSKDVTLENDSSKSLSEKLELVIRQKIIF